MGILVSDFLREGKFSVCLLRSNKLTVLSV